MSLPKLTEVEIADHLQRLPDWKREGDAIRRRFEFATFVDSMRFVNEVAENAEAVKHHPDIDIRYNKVILTLTTHDSGGLTLNDVEFAASVDGMADATAA